MSSEKIEVRYQPVKKREGAVRVTGINGKARISFEFVPGNEESTEDLEFLVGSAVLILDAGVQAALEASEDPA